MADQFCNSVGILQQGAAPDQAAGFDKGKDKRIKPGF